MMIVWGLLFATPWINLDRSLLKRLKKILDHLKYLEWLKKKGMF